MVVNNTGETHLVCAGSKTFIESMLWTSSSSKCFAFGPAWYETEYVGLVSGGFNSTLRMAVFMWPKCPFHSDLNGSGMQMKSSWYATYSSGILMELRQSLNT